MKIENYQISRIIQLPLNMLQNTGKYDKVVRILHIYLLIN